MFTVKKPNGEIWTMTREEVWETALWSLEKGDFVPELYKSFNFALVWLSEKGYKIEKQDNRVMKLC